MNNTTHPMADGPNAEHIVVMVIGSIGVLFNSATLLVLTMNFTRVFTKTEACFVTNLAMADLLTGLAGTLWAALPLFIPYDKTTGDTLICVMWISVAASFLTLACMACERLLVIAYPLKAKRVFQKSTVYICCALVWFVSVLTGSMIALDRFIVFFVMIVLFEVSLIATFCCYVVIYRTVKKLRTDSLRCAARYSAQNANLSLEVEENESALHHLVTVRQESRVTNLIFVLVIVLTVTVLPYMILLQINVSYGLFCPECSPRDGLLKTLHYVFPLEMVNFALNPVIYAWRLPKFRQVSKKTFRRLFCKLCRRNADTREPANYSYSSDTDSVDHGAARTIFTGQDTGAGAPLNNNQHAC